jgi:protein SCO1/2
MTSKTERSGIEAPRNPQRRSWFVPVSRPRTASAIPDVPVVTHDGRTVRFHSDLVRGRVVFINMMYAQCSNQCPPTTQNLRRVHAALGARVGRDVFMYSLTLLPEYDSPADLRAYMRQQDVGPNWTFLTGRKQDVERIRRGLGFSDPDPELDADITRHTSMVRVGNDALDRWTMVPSMVSANQILECLMSVDPATRAKGRILIT